MQPSPFSPSSRSAFRAAEGDHDAAVSEKPRVTLLEWWLATVEGDDQKVAVAGTFEWKRTLHELCPAPIVKRHSLDLLESEDGTELHISGSHNITRTRANGYSNAVCENFRFGFPRWWQSCNKRYPKLTNLGTGCQPSSCNTSNSERYAAISKEVNNMETDLVRGSHSRKRGHDDIATDVSLDPIVECTNNAVSEAVDSTPATGTYRKNTPVASLKSQGSRRENQHVASNKRPVGRPKKRISPHEKCQSATSHDDIAIDVSLAPTVDNNAVNEAVESTPATGT